MNTAVSVSYTHLDVYKRQLVKKPINWDSKDMELNSGSIDCIWNGFTINGREDDYTSVSYTHL